MTLIAHITDVHLPPVPSTDLTQVSVKQLLGYFNWLLSRQFDHSAEVLYLMVDDLGSQNKDHILFSGDAVNIALREEFEHAFHWMSSLGTPDQLSFVPGNHDYYSEQFEDQLQEQFAPYMSSDNEGAKLGGAIGPLLPFVRLIDKVAIIGVNSAIPTAPFRADGEISEPTFVRLKTILRRAKEAGYYRCIMIHHPPFEGMTKAHRALRNAHEFEVLISSYGAELILYGHNHRQRVDRFDTPDGVCHVVGTPSFTMARDKKYDLARYNIFEISKDGAQWVTKMYGRGLLAKGGQVGQIERCVL